MNYGDPIRIIERLLPRIQFSADGCWEYQGSTDTNGYGLFSVNGHSHHVHRIVYTIFVGPVADDELVCHHCDNRPCIRPSHLFLGTQTDNMRDMVAKGRGRYPNAEKEYCLRGHPRTPANLYIAPKTGYKTCRVCHKLQEREKRAQKRVWCLSVTCTRYQVTHLTGTCNETCQSPDCSRKEEHFAGYCWVPSL